LEIALATAYLETIGNGAVKSQRTTRGPLGKHPEHYTSTAARVSPSVQAAR